MKELNHHHKDLIACLKHYYPQLLVEMKSGMKQDKWVLATYRSKPLEVAIEHFCKEVLRLLKTSESFERVMPGKQFSLDEARNQVRFHFLAQNLFLRALRKVLEVSDKEWIKIYDELTRIFETSLRDKVAVNCAQCRCSMQEDLAKARKLETELAKVLPQDQN
jgi:hypothetical protein